MLSLGVLAVAELAVGQLRSSPSQAAADATKADVLRTIDAILYAEPDPVRRACLVLEAMGTADLAPVRAQVQTAADGLAGIADPKVEAMRNWMRVMVGDDDPALAAAAAATPVDEFSAYTEWGTRAQERCADVDVELP